MPFSKPRISIPLVAERDALKADLGIVNHYFPEGINNVKAVIAENDTLKKRVEELSLCKASLIEVLDKLAMLGNGINYGNNEGNMIARAALSSIREKAGPVPDLNIPEQDEDPKETSPHPVTVNGKTPGQVLRESITDALMTMGYGPNKPWDRYADSQKEAYAMAERAVLHESTDKIQALSLQLEEAQEKLAESKLDSERLDFILLSISRGWISLMEQVWCNGEKMNRDAIDRVQKALSKVGKESL